MSVETFNQPNSTGMICDVYPPAIDASISVLARIGAAFAPHAQATPNMTVVVDAGHVFDGVTLTEVAAQSTSAITAPTANPRIDRVVINQLTGVASVVTGTEAASPVAPSITSGTAPIARVLLQTTSTTITNDMITDERDLSCLGRIIAVEAGTGLTGSGSAGTVTISLDTPVAVDLGGTGTVTAAANTVFAGPSSGDAAPPSFRSLRLADLPANIATTEEVAAAVAVETSRAEEVEAVLTPLSAFGVSLTFPGYQKLPSGLIFQWGGGAYPGGTSGSTYTLSYPIAFPNTSLGIVGCVGAEIGTTTMGFQLLSARQYVIGAYNPNDTMSIVAGYCWFAWGY